jgi:hypothetical protein
LLVCSISHALLCICHCAHYTGRSLRFSCRSSRLLTRARATQPKPSVGSTYCLRLDFVRRPPLSTPSLASCMRRADRLMPRGCQCHLLSSDDVDGDTIACHLLGGDVGGDICSHVDDICGGGVYRTAVARCSDRSTSTQIIHPAVMSTVMSTTLCKRQVHHTARSVGGIRPVDVTSRSFIHLHYPVPMCVDQQLHSLRHTRASRTRARMCPHKGP